MGCPGPQQAMGEGQSERGEGQPRQGALERWRAQRRGHPLQPAEPQRDHRPERLQALQVPGLMAQPSMCNLAAEDQRLTKGPKPWAVEPNPGPGARPWRQAAHQPKGAGGEPGGGGAADVGDPGVCHAGLRGVGPQ